MCMFYWIQVLEKEPFQKQMLEKLIWISAFMLVGARHPGAMVGAVEKEYRSEVRIFSWHSYKIVVLFHRLSTSVTMITCIQMCCNHLFTRQYLKNIVRLEAKTGDSHLLFNYQSCMIEL